MSSALYIGDVPLRQRFLLSADQLFNPLYCRPYEDYNIWLYTLKCSLFGEFSFAAGTRSHILIAANLVLIWCRLRQWFMWRRGREVGRFVRLGLWIWLTQMVSFILFNLKYPMGCTMDFRYIVPTVFTGAASSALR